MRSQLEFVQNLWESDYVLCARGMATTRIACTRRWPVAHPPVHRYRLRAAVRLRDRLEAVRCVGGPPDLRSVADRVAEFHASISGDEFEELQVACRRLWEEWLSPEAFFANFHRHLEVIDLPGRNL